MNPKAPPPDPNAALAGALCVLVPFALVAVYGLIYPGRKAWQRGYNPLVWATAAAASLNPVMILVLLALVPNRARVRLRERFAGELNAKLAAARAPLPVARAVGRPARDVSIGDAATEFPQRSIGDDQTRL